MARQKEFDRSLFLAAVIDRYRRVVAGELFETLAAPGSGIEAIRSFFRLRVQQALDRQRPHGCLATNSAVELSRRDGPAVAEVSGSLAQLEAAFRCAPECARAAGELAPARDLRALARFLTSSAQGLSVMARTRSDRAVLEDIVPLILAVLNGARPRSIRRRTRRKGPA